MEAIVCEGTGSGYRSLGDSARRREPKEKDTGITASALNHGHVRQSKENETIN
jgi:hypothetical protein